MASKPQRLFFALWPDKQTRRALIHTAGPWYKQAARPQHPLDLHMTLVFLGMVEPQRMACLLRAADQVRFNPFSVPIEQLGYLKRPRILWCGPLQPPDPLQRLVADLQQSLQACGFIPEARPYFAHVTLARKASPLDTRMLERPFDWPVESFALVLSRSGGEPPRYEVLKKWPADS